MAAVCLSKDGYKMVLILLTTTLQLLTRVAPGGVRTPLLEAVAESSKDPKLYKEKITSSSVTCFIYLSSNTNLNYSFLCRFTFLTIIAINTVCMLYLLCYLHDNGSQITLFFCS